MHPKVRRDRAPKWQAAMEALMHVAMFGVPTMLLLLVFTQLFYARSNVSFFRMRGFDESG
jgi:hypothetical protein